MTVCMTKNIGLSALQADFFETTDIHRLIRIAFRSSLYICVHRLPHLRRGNPLWLPPVVAHSKGRHSKGRHRGLPLRGLYATFSTEKMQIPILSS